MRQIIFTLVALFAIQSTAFATSYTIDKDHSTASFTIRHLVSKVKGNFNDFSGKIDFDEKNISKSSVDANFKVDSIDTHVSKRDDHLKSPDFFDAKKFPDMTFKSTKVLGSAKNMTVVGTLNLHGVEKPVILKAQFNGTAKDPWGNLRAGFSATGKINRKDFGLTWNKAIETGGMMVGDDVDLSFEIEAIQDKAPGAENPNAKEASKEESKKK